MSETLPVHGPCDAQQKNDAFDQQTDPAFQTWRLKLAEEISWLRTFFSGSFCWSG
jgi:hypothetical protein